MTELIGAAVLIISLAVIGSALSICTCLCENTKRIIKAIHEKDSNHA